MPGFFDRIFYGKDKPDLEKKEQEVHPFQLFFEVLTVRFTGLVKLNFLFLLFLLPAILWTFVIFPGGVEPISIASAKPGDVFEYFYAYLFWFTLFILPAAPGIAGMTYVTRNWAKNDHAWIGSDFMEHYKKNWKQSLIVTVIDMLLLIAIVFYFVNGQGFVRILAMIFGLLLVMVNQYVFPMMVTYKLSVLQIFRNSILLTLARLHISILIAVVTLLPIGLGIGLAGLFGALPLLVVGVYYLVFGFSATALMISSFTNTSFKRYMKPTEDHGEPNP